MIFYSTLSTCVAVGILISTTVVESGSKTLLESSSNPVSYLGTLTFFGDLRLISTIRIIDFLFFCFFY